MSSVATCNAYLTTRAVQTAKKVNPDIFTVTGGQHYTALAQESLEKYPELDLIIRGEGEKTLTEILGALPWDSTLKNFKKGIVAEDSRKAVELLKENGILAHAMFVIGERNDTHEEIAYLREFANDKDPDFVIFTVLKPFPGTEIYDDALLNGCMEDTN